MTDLHLRALRWFGRQRWIPLGTDRVLRAFCPPGAVDLAFDAPLYGGRFAGNLRSYIDWNVYFRGVYEEFAVETLRAIARFQRAAAGRRVVYWDIGANAGNHVVAMSDLTDRTFAFEPFTAVREQLERNVALSGFGHATVMPVALGDRPAVLPFFAPADENQGVGSLHEAPDRKPAGHVEVAVGDDLVSSGAAEAPSIIKIDVEGHEPAVLRGLRRTLDAARPWILMELSDATRSELGGEAAFRELLYDHHAPCSVGATRGRRPRLSRFDWPTSQEVLIAPAGDVAAFSAHSRLPLDRLL